MAAALLCIVISMRDALTAPGSYSHPLSSQHSADLADKAGQHQQLWEHFVLLGQFQGRRHRCGLGLEARASQPCSSQGVRAVLRPRVSCWASSGAAAKECKGVQTQWLQHHCVGCCASPIGAAPHTCWAALPHMSHTSPSSPALAPASCRLVANAAHVALEPDPLHLYPAVLRRFSCPLQVGNTYRLGYVKARGPRCFDHNYYAASNPDLQEAGLRKSEPGGGCQLGVKCRQAAASWV